MAASELYVALLRPAVVQILRATGFSYAKPTVIDAVTDLAVRYLLLLGSSTAQNAFNCHNDFVPTIQDVRTALAEVGALRPQMSTAEEALRDPVELNGEVVPFEDMRGVQAFISWAHGVANKEIRRIAGFGDEIDVNEIAAGVEEMEDYVTALKKKHSKTAEESRYQGTLLGKDGDAASVAIAGGQVALLSEWLTQQAQSTSRPYTGTADAQNNEGDDDDDDDDDADMEGVTTEAQSPATSGISSAPLTPVAELTVSLATVA